MLSNNPLETSLKLDSHADTTVLRAGTLIIQSYDRPVEVVGYDPQQSSQTFETVSGVLTFDHPKDGQVYHLVFHQAIHMPQLDHHLLCPMQCCVNDVTVKGSSPKFVKFSNGTNIISECFLTCSTRSPHDILKVLLKKYDWNLTIGCAKH